MNKLVSGAKLCAMLALTLLCGYVGQIVSADSKIRNLEGPVFGKQIGVYQSESMDKDWSPLVVTSSFASAYPAGGTLDPVVTTSTSLRTSQRGEQSTVAALKKASD